MTYLKITASKRTVIPKKTLSKANPALYTRFRLQLKFNLKKDAFNLKDCLRQFLFLAAVDQCRDDAYEEQAQDKKQHAITFMCSNLHLILWTKVIYFKAMNK